jgi:2-polyprenyl-3-methyl-5-hydroxy-6-metoxy-1,4-benzoquinol methylase
MDKEQIFKRIKVSTEAEKNLIIPGLCKGLSVLDVGCVGQDYDYDNPLWLHNLIKSSSASLDGVDIQEEGIRLLREKGYSVFSAEDLSISVRSYDIIVMSDVIEHVNDPVGFLKFYAGFLVPGGKILITTPNAHGIRNFTSILIRNSYSVNPEHTLWLCPKTMLEIASRAGLEFVDFFWLREYYRFKDIKGFRYRLIWRINRLFEKIRSNFHPNFLIILTK